jgi:hypothetical protein
LLIASSATTKVGHRVGGGKSDDRFTRDERIVEDVIAVFALEGCVDKAGPKDINCLVSMRPPCLKQGSPEKEFADMTLVKELDESGFIDALYRQKK